MRGALFRLPARVITRLPAVYSDRIPNLRRWDDGERSTRSRGEPRLAAAVAARRQLRDHAQAERDTAGLVSLVVARRAGRRRSDRGPSPRTPARSSASGIGDRPPPIPMAVSPA